MNDNNYIWFGEFSSESYFVPILLTVITFALVFIMIGVPLYLRFFYKGKNRTVEIVKRRKTMRDMFDPERDPANSYVEFVNYTVDVRYDGSRSLHTFSCDEEIFNSLEEGKTYNVHISCGSVTEIHGG